VVFDQQFLSALGLNKFGFTNSQPERRVGYPGRIPRNDGEHAGTVDNLTTINVDHWNDNKIEEAKKSVSGDAEESDDNFF